MAAFHLADLAETDIEAKRRKAVPVISTTTGLSLQKTD